MGLDHTPDTTSITYLSGDKCVLNLEGCVHVIDTRTKLWQKHPHYLPQEIVLVDFRTGNVLKNSDPLPQQLSVVLREENRSDSCVWSCALTLFAEMENQAGAFWCASEVMKMTL